MILEELSTIQLRADSLCHCWLQQLQVLYYEDFVPCQISQSSFDMLMSTDWQRYGFKLKGGLMGDEGNAVLEWDNMTFARIDIAIHTYHE